MLQTLRVGGGTEVDGRSTQEDGGAQEGPVTGRHHREVVGKPGGSQGGSGTRSNGDGGRRQEGTATTTEFMLITAACPTPCRGYCDILDKC